MKSTNVISNLNRMRWEKDISLETHQLTIPAMNVATGYFHTVETSSLSRRPIGFPAYKILGIAKKKVRTDEITAMAIVPKDSPMITPLTEITELTIPHLNNLSARPNETCSHPFVDDMMYIPVATPIAEKILAVEPHCGPNNKYTNSLLATTMNPLSGIPTKEMAAIAFK